MADQNYGNDVNQGAQREGAIESVTVGPGGAAGQQVSQGVSQGGERLPNQGVLDPVTATRLAGAQAVPQPHINPATGRRYDEHVPGGVYLDDKGNAHDAHGNSLHPEAVKNALGKAPEPLKADDPRVLRTDSERALRGVPQPVPPPVEEEEIKNEEEDGFDKRSRNAAGNAGDAGEPGRPTKASVDQGQKAQDDFKQQKEKDEKAKRDREQQREQQSGQRNGGQRSQQS